MVLHVNGLTTDMGSFADKGPFKTLGIYEILYGDYKEVSEIRLGDSYRGKCRKFPYGDVLRSRIPVNEVLICNHVKHCLV